MRNDTELYPWGCELGMKDQGQSWHTLRSAGCRTEPVTLSHENVAREHLQGRTVAQETRNKSCIIDHIPA